MAIQSNLESVKKITDDIKESGKQIADGAVSVSYDDYTTTHPKSAMKNSYENLKDNSILLLSILKRDAESVLKIAQDFEKLDEDISREYER